MANAKQNHTIITARAQHELVTPRKANLVLKAIVGRPALLAIKQLAMMPKRAAEPIAKLVKQAVGNAVSNNQASPDSLIIDSAFATKGRALKRAHIGGRGRTKPFERVAAHLTLNLRIVNGPAITAPKAVKAVKAVKTEPVATVEAVVEPKVAKKTIKKTTKK